LDDASKKLEASMKFFVKRGKSKAAQEVADAADSENDD
jgi:hypothetical protein